MNEKEKNASIEFILDKGLVVPPTLWERVTKMHRVLGWKFIFWDFSYSMIFVAITLLGIVLLFDRAPMEYIYSVAVGFSPMLFLSIMFFAEVNERACGLYELKQTCLFTSRQITALRCMYYSLAGVAFAIVVTAFAAENIAQFFRILPLCLGGLFLCATIGLSAIRISRSKWAVAVFSVTWTFINLVLPFTFGQSWETLLSTLPLVFTIAFAIAVAAAFIYQTNKMLTEEKQYAYA